VKTQEETPEGLVDKTVYMAPSRSSAQDYIEAMKTHYKYPLRIETGPPPPKRIYPPIFPTRAEIPVYHPEPPGIEVFNEAPKEIRSQAGHYLDYLLIEKKPWDNGLQVMLRREFRRYPSGWTEVHQYRRSLAAVQYQPYLELIEKLKSLKGREPTNQEKILAILQATRQSLTHTLAAALTEMSPEEADTAMRELVRKEVVATIPPAYLPSILGESQRLPYILVKPAYRLGYILNPARPLPEEAIEWRYDPEKVRGQVGLEGYFSKP
jgi:uncharacterized protein YbdZ (MbtH family)